VWQWVDLFKAVAMGGSVQSISSIRKHREVAQAQLLILLSLAQLSPPQYKGIIFFFLPMYAG